MDDTTVDVEEDEELGGVFNSVSPHTPHRAITAIMHTRVVSSFKFKIRIYMYIC